MPQAGPAFSNYPAVLGCPDLLLKKRKKNKTVAGITQDQQTTNVVVKNKNINARKFDNEDIDIDRCSADVRRVFVYTVFIVCFFPKVQPREEK